LCTLVGVGYGSPNAARSTENPLGLSVRGLECLSSSAFTDRVAAASRVRREAGRGRHRREHSKREAGSKQPAQARPGEHFRHLLSLVDHGLDARSGSVRIASGECLSQIGGFPVSRDEG